MAGAAAPDFGGPLPTPAPAAVPEPTPPPPVEVPTPPPAAAPPPAPPRAGGAGRRRRRPPPRRALGPASAPKEVTRTADGLVVTVSLGGGGVAADGSASVALMFGNDSANAVEGLVAEVAVPKYLTVDLGAPSATSLPPEPLPGFGPTLPPITQPLTLKQTGAAVKPIKLKVKVSYTVGGAAKVEMISVGPEHLG